MKIPIFHFTDMHICNTDNVSELVDYNSLIRSLKSATESAEKCVFVVSGDISNRGKAGEFSNAAKFLHGIAVKLKEDNKNLEVDFLYTPGNHDVDFDYTPLKNNLDELLSKNKILYRNNTSENLAKVYVDAMLKFYNFSEQGNCRWDNKLVNRKIIDCSGFRIGFTLINSVMFSLLENQGNDKGFHTLYEDQLQVLENIADADFNILVTHHGIDWFDNDSQRRIREALSRRYDMFLFGHEHDEVAENRGTDMFSCYYQQGIALIDKSRDENGYNLIMVDTEEMEYGTSLFVKKRNVYKQGNITTNKIDKLSYKDILLNEEGKKFLSEDDQGNSFTDYYVFPRLSYEMIDETNKIRKYKIETIDELAWCIFSNDTIHVYGDTKSGKTLLSKNIFRMLYEKNYIPIVFYPDSFRKSKNEEQIVEYAFNDYYEKEDDKYELFLQTSIDEKIAIIDDADRITSTSLKIATNILSKKFGKVIIIGKDEASLDLAQQIKDSIYKKIEIRIEPFYYDRRKLLIEKVIDAYYPENNQITATQIINSFFDNSYSYFYFNPVFIINFTKQYMNNSFLNPSGERNIYSIVFQNSIDERIIKASEESPEIINIILGEIAYYMHFNKKTCIDNKGIDTIVANYREEYRQDITTNNFINVAIKSEILIENDCNYRFKDKSHFAYFVAKALNKKVTSDPDDHESKIANENFKKVLDNLCFGVNSDIVLFLSLITENLGFLKIIITKASEHFEKMEEFDIGKNNISFFSTTQLMVKESTPNQKDRERHEKIKSENEELSLENGNIEVIDEYDYDEQDLEKMGNQIMLSFKYIDIISKALPAFCTNLKRIDQDLLVDLIYSATNKFIYQLLHKMDVDLDEYAKALAADAKENGIDINKDRIKELLCQVSGLFVAGIYSKVATSCSTRESIKALNQEKYENGNINNKIQNLMICQKVQSIDEIADKSIKLDEEFKGKVFPKSLVKMSVWEYLLHSDDIKMIGKADSLTQHFFGRKARKQITKKTQINKYRKNKRKSNGKKS